MPARRQVARAFSMGANPLTGLMATSLRQEREHAVEQARARD